MQSFWIYEDGVPRDFFGIGFFVLGLGIAIALLSFFKPKWLFVVMQFIAMPLLILFLLSKKLSPWNRILEKADESVKKSQGKEKIIGVTMLPVAGFLFYIAVLSSNFQLIYNDKAVWMAGGLSNQNTPTLRYQDIDSILTVKGGGKSRSSVRLRINTIQGVSVETHNTSEKAALGLQQFFVAKVKLFNPKVRSICMRSDSDCLKYPK